MNSRGKVTADVDVGHGLVSKVKAAIDKHEMMHSGDGIVVGVSGGPDSVALLYVLHILKSERDLRLSAAHLDHGLRAESGRDAEFTRELSASLGIEAHVQTADVRGMASELGLSMEEAGRRARYDFFERVRAEVDARSIATAHHLDDQMETFFLRVLRGSTLTGLGGIPPRRERIIRPLIEARRSEILAFLQERGIPYRTDRSNLSDDTDRNFIRNRLMPLIARRFPDFSRPLTRTMNSVREEEEFLGKLASDLQSGTARRCGAEVLIDIPRVRDAPRVLARRSVLKSLYELSGPSVRWAKVHVDTILDVVHGENPSTEIHLPGGIVLFREYDLLSLTSERPEEPVPFFMSADGPGELRVPSTGAIVSFDIVGPGRETHPDRTGPWEAFFDADVARFPLTVRSMRPGDRFRPWGMKGTRKLKEVLIDVKVPRRLRMRIPLLEKDTEILWVPGVRRGRGASIVPQTNKILRVRVTGLAW
ncbi:MAG: tRNA lysidine(34) synthetase TilS [Desulfomonilaceae bacterium]|nr:tRNA lysidine(34) synthetase TilS [Desulfomonilaceae bacterium]